MFGSLFKKKLRILLYEKNIGWQELKGTLSYKKDRKEWMLEFAGEKLPAPKNIFELICKNTLIVRREAPDKYIFLNPNVVSKEGKMEEYEIPPEEIVRAFIRAEERRLRMASFWERNIALIVSFIVIIIVGIFIAIVWSSTGDSIREISQNFKDAMLVLNNITQTQLEILEKVRGVESLPPLTR